MLLKRIILIYAWLEKMSSFLKQDISLGLFVCYWVRVRDCHIIESKTEGRKKHFSLKCSHLILGSV